MPSPTQQPPSPYRIAPPANNAAGLKRFPANAPALLQASAYVWGNTSNKSHLGELPDGAVAGATAFTSELFRYTGTAPTTLTINFDLELEVDDLPADPAGLATALAEVAVFANTPNYRFLDDLSALVNDHGATVLASDIVSIVGDTNDFVERQATLTFDVNPGGTFYVWQKLTATAVRGQRFADAYAPMISGFNHPELVHSIMAVPEPASLGLASLAGLALAIMRRRTGRS